MLRKVKIVSVSLLALIAVIDVMNDHFMNGESNFRMIVTLFVALVAVISQLNKPDDEEEDKREPRRIK